MLIEESSKFLPLHAIGRCKLSVRGVVEDDEAFAHVVFPVVGSADVAGLGGSAGMQSEEVGGRGRRLVHVKSESRFASLGADDFELVRDVVDQLICRRDAHRFQHIGGRHDRR